MMRLGSFAALLLVLACSAVHAQRLVPLNTQPPMSGFFLFQSTTGCGLLTSSNTRTCTLQVYFYDNRPTISDLDKLEVITDACIQVGSTTCDRSSYIRAASCTLPNGGYCEYEVVVTGPSSLPTGVITVSLRVKPVMIGPWYVQQVGYPLGDIPIGGFPVASAAPAASSMMIVIAAVAMLLLMLLL